MTDRVASNLASGLDGRDLGQHVADARRQRPGVRLATAELIAKLEPAQVQAVLQPWQPVREEGVEVEPEAELPERCAIARVSSGTVQRLGG
jgi:hypothetical protein